jgi:transposase
MRPHGSPEQLERRRHGALALLQQGLLPVEVARRVGVDRRSVRRWKAAYRQQGKRGLQAKPAFGRPPRLSALHKRRLETHLLKGAKAAGFATDLWTCPRIAQLIHAKFGTRYHVDHIGRLLHAMGWSPQRPARRAVERDEERIQRWIQQQWPAIKKKPDG